jgi:hypothetical protein
MRLYIIQETFRASNEYDDKNSICWNPLIFQFYKRLTSSESNSVATPRCGGRMKLLVEWVGSRISGLCPIGCSKSPTGEPAPPSI